MQAEEIYQGSIFCMGSPNIVIIDMSTISPKIVLYGGNSDCQMASFAQENKFVKIFDIKKKTVVFEREVPNYQGLEFTNLGYSDSRIEGNGCTVVFMKSFIASTKCFSFLKIQKLSENNWIFAHENYNFE